jgi:hydrogenase expression/formation protein HypC
MCLGVPARIITLEGSEARVLVGNVEYPVSMRLLPGAVVGDFVLVHAGFAIEKIDPEEAAETARLLEEITRFDTE